MRICINRKNATALYAIIHALYFCTCALVSGYASAYLLNRGFSNAQIGIMLGIGNLGAVGFQLLIASFIAHTGMQLGKAIIAVHAVMAALALALLLLPVSNIVFCIMYVLEFLLLTSMQSSINSLYRGYHEQGTKINFALSRGVGSAAYSLTGLVTGMLIQKFTPDILPGMYAASSILLCAVVFVFNAPNVTERQVSSVTPAEKKILMREYPQFYIFFAGVLCLATTNGFTETFLLQIIQRIGGNSSNLGVAVFISAMMELPAMIFYRRFADKVGNRRLLGFAGWMWALKNFLIMLAPNVYLIYAAEILQFAGFAFYVPAGVRFIAHTLPESEFLKGQAIVGSAFTAGYLISSFAGGMMIDLIGLRATMWGVQLFSISGVLLFSIAMRKSLSMFPSVRADKEKK